jgi:hypothetical protein
MTRLAHHRANESVFERQAMSHRSDPDLFDSENQPDLFGEDSPAPVYRADPDKVRVRLHKILAEARAADVMPWETARTSLYRAIFPQMTRSLPDEEAAQLRFAFEAEMERLKAA